jgi:hypothetical protein
MKLVEFYKILYYMKTELAYELNVRMKYTKYDGYCYKDNFITFYKGGQVSFTNNDIKQIITELFQNQYPIQVSYITPYDDWYKNSYLINIQYNKHSTLTFLLKTIYNRCWSISLILNREQKVFYETNRLL